MVDDISQHSMKDLLSGAADYLIPMYQRNYAWGEAEITQLIQDVLDEIPEQSAGTDRARPYYIGTLVVFYKGKDKSSDRPLYEVIDGQQRLTTLFLLASYFLNRENGSGQTQCGWFARPCVRFESRPRSSKAMQAVFEGQAEPGEVENLHAEEFNGDIINGYELIQKLVPKLSQDNRTSPEHLADYLFSQVQIMRVRVPDDTDLNHYFEIMNNRGEQLEKHEVLKSRLMGKLDPTDRSVLHKVWEACANMERYVQMGFSPQERDQLFGERNWGELQPNDFAGLRKALASESETGGEAGALTLTQLVAPSAGMKSAQKRHREIAEEAPERFNTVINYPNFLLQVLRVTTGIDIALDDKRLISAFEEHILRADDAVEEVRAFIYNLLKCKYLFDHYIIKREFSGNTDAWSLKRLKWQASNNSNDYVNTFGDEAEHGDANRRVLMLLSALHVSTPTMVYKHWLNAALHYLFHAGTVEYQGYLSYLECVARCFVFDRFLPSGEGAEYYDIIYRNKGQPQARDWSDIDESKLSFGAIANNLVFNYLDYLLWLQYKKKQKVRDDDFTFRSSVEHFYPQRPMPGVDALPKEALDSFGNLCLISHSKNSRLSNLTPKAKKDYYADGGIDSIKQWLMMKPERWTQSEIENHNREMLNLFKEDLGKTVQ